MTGKISLKAVLYCSNGIKCGSSSQTFRKRTPMLGYTSSTLDTENFEYKLITVLRIEKTAETHLLRVRTPVELVENNINDPI